MLFRSITSQQVRDNYSYYNLIITDDESLLDLPNTVFYLWGGCWVKPIEMPTNKDFNISFLASYGPSNFVLLDGYDMRMKFWQMINSINTPKKFYLSKRNPLPNVDGEIYNFETKDNLFNSMFHIAIENSKNKNFFTEKLIDCFQTYTVPIYYGCSNIGDYFDLDGIIICNDEQQLVNACNTVTPELYQKMLPHLIENKKRSEQYVNPFLWVKNKILECSNNINIRKQDITNLYHNILNREPDIDGLKHYFNSKHSIEQIKNILLNSEEYILLTDLKPQL